MKYSIDITCIELNEFLDQLNILPIHRVLGELNSVLGESMVILNISLNSSPDNLRREIVFHFESCEVLKSVNINVPLTCNRTRQYFLLFNPKKGILLVTNDIVEMLEIPEVSLAEERYRSKDSCVVVSIPNISITKDEFINDIIHPLKDPKIQKIAIVAWGVDAYDVITAYFNCNCSDKCIAHEHIHMDAFQEMIKNNLNK